MSKELVARTLAAPITESHVEVATVKDYLIELLATLWIQGDGFSGKRPFGNSGWQYDIYSALVNAGLITGQFDRHGYLETFDEDEADRLILAAIEALR